jgi:cytoskeleton protein RodZ
VVDATGKRLVFGTLAAGTTRDVAGVPPFKLKIGNAPAMALSYEGAAVDLKDKTRGTTAKLELN